MWSPPRTPFGWGRGRMCHVVPPTRIQLYARNMFTPLLTMA